MMMMMTMGYTAQDHGGYSLIHGESHAQTRLFEVGGANWYVEREHLDGFPQIATLLLQLRSVYMTVTMVYCT